MYQALYRKYRPQTFDDLIGQMAVTQTLKSQLQTGRLSHAYLFTGSRGTGKTSSAKILAKAVNCENLVDGNPCNCCAACRSIDSGACMDVLEIDAASNNGVENVRDLRDDAVYTPSQVRKRVYIIDEVHMLSISAFNALLKIIEEPPEHLLFILATTELHKVPATILSRCQRFAFRRISLDDIAARLQYVAYQEQIDLDDSAARIIARLADGGMRDALSLLDQCASATAGELNAQRIYSCLGIAGIQECGSLLAAVAAHDTKSALTLLNRSYAEGKDLGAMLDELICLLRDLMILKTAPKEGISLLSGVAEDTQAQSLSSQFSVGELQYMLNVVQNTRNGFTRSASKRMDTELCLINLCQPELILDAKSINARLTRVEEQIQSGDITVKHVQKLQEPIAQVLEDTTTADNAELVQQTIEVPVSQDVPVGFWADVVTDVRAELPLPASGYFTTAPGAVLNGVVRGDILYLEFSNPFPIEFINKPDVLEVVSRKASYRIGRKLQVKIVDLTTTLIKNENMEQLMNFSKEHPSVVKIRSEFD